MSLLWMPQPVKKREGDQDNAKAKHGADEKTKASSKHREELLKNTETIYWSFDRSGDGVIDEEEFVAGLCLSDEMWGLFSEVNPFRQHQIHSIFQGANRRSKQKRQLKSGADTNATSGSATKKH